MRPIHPFFLVLLAVFTQDRCTAQAVNADSLWLVWNTATAADTARLKAMHALAKEVFLYKEPDSAYVLAGLQRDLAQRIGNTHFAGEALNTQGISFAIRGRMDDALAHFEQAFAVFEAAADSFGMGGALYNIGNFHMRVGAMEQGLAEMQRSLQISEAVGNVRTMTHCYHGIGRYHEQRGEFDEALVYYTKSLETFRSSGDDRGVITALIGISGVHIARGDHEGAINALGEALRIAEAIHDEASIGNCLDRIGNLHARQDDHAKAMVYYERSFAHSESSSDKEGMMHSLINMGNAASDLKRPEEAITYLERSAAIARELGDRKSEAIALNNLCMVYSELGQVEKALENCQRGLELKRASGYSKGVSNSLANIGTVLIRAGRFREALPYSEEALSLAQEAGNATEVRDVARDLSRIYKVVGRADRSLAMFELYVQMKDSIDREENQRAVLRQEYKYSYEKQALADSLSFAQKEAVNELEIRRRDADLAKQRIGLAASVGGAGLLLLLAISIRRGKARSDELLHNILPKEVAAELKAKGEADARLFDVATVLFTDFKGFTQLSEQVTPAELVAELNACFRVFDGLMEKHGIEKIKTIGDAYMAAGGVPDPQHGRPADVVLAALEMQDFMKQHKAEREAQGKPFFEMRVGIHSGPVVAGIVGVKKFQYDIWGDTVNTASRMESSGEVGQVNISEATYALVKDASIAEDGVASSHWVDLDGTGNATVPSQRPAFSFTLRGKVQAKGKGEMEMFFVERG